MTKRINQRKKKEQKNKNQNEEIDEEICESENVDGNPQATPASAKTAYEEDEDDTQNVSCRQM
jgi:hypothetical protein